MMKTSITKTLMFGLMAAVLFVSCNEKQSNEAYPDVYVQAKTVGSATQYSLYQWAFSYDQMSAVEVTDPFGDTYELENFENKGYSFFKEDAYSTLYPLTGNYIFKVTFKNGEVATYMNQLKEVSFTSVQNLKAEETTAESKPVVKLSWLKLTGASAYQVVVKKGDGKEVFRSGLFSFTDDTETTGSLNLTTAIFTNYIPNTFTFDVVAFKFEAGDNSKYDAVSVASTTLAID